jgi:hypothetical protein
MGRTPTILKINIVRRRTVARCREERVATVALACAGDVGQRFRADSRVIATFRPAVELAAANTQ